MPIRVISRRPPQSAPSHKSAAPPFGLPAAPVDSQQKPAGISLCMIVKNEERFLERCLASIAGAVDEINVVDTGSTDRTIEIAQKYGARIERREWRNDFGWARNESLKMATKRWILQLDADEELLPESKAALREIAQAPAHLMGVWIRCVNASDKYRGGGSVSHAIVRIFPNHERIRFCGAIHEFPSLDNAPISITAVHSPVKILHHGYLNDIVGDRDKYARNMAIVEASITAEPDESFHWYNFGMTAHLGGDEDRGIEGFTRMWELCRKTGMRAFTPNGLQTLADIHTEVKNEPEQGLQYALEALKLAPHYANAHFSAGKAYFTMKRFDEARAMYERAIEDAPHLTAQFVVDDEVPVWKAQCEIGSTYVEQGDDARAVEWFERGIRNRPKVQPLRINYACALERLRRLSEAEAVFRSVYEDFGDEQSALNYVNYLLRHGKEREGIDILERSYSKFSPEAAESALLACAAIAQKNRWGDGESYLLQAQAIVPQSAQVAAALDTLRANRGEVGKKLASALEALNGGLFDDALTRAQEGLALMPGHGGLSYYAALACANLQRKEEALEYLGRSVDALGEGPALLKAALLRELGRPEEALDAIAIARAQNPSNVDTAIVQASLLESLGRLADAETALLGALPFERKRVAVELAAILLRTGRVDEAKRIAEEALT